MKGYVLALAVLTAIGFSGTAVAVEAVHPGWPAGLIANMKSMQQAGLILKPRRACCVGVPGVGRDCAYTYLGPLWNCVCKKYGGIPVWQCSPPVIKSS
jgi:hypothetical protein